MSLYAKNISVTFPGIKALDGVNIGFEDKRIKAVLGANGSGKSTLVKVLTGVYAPESGSAITVDGKEVNAVLDPNHASALGIRVVHQEAPLISSMSVAESIAMYKGYPRNKAGLIQWKKLYQYSEELLGSLGVLIDPKELINNISAAERAMLLMSVAIGGSDEERSATKLLILDEAESSLDEHEAEKFLTKVRNISNYRIPVCIVTHRLKAVRSICDDIALLDNGKIVFDGKAGEIEDRQIINVMVKSNRAAATEEKSEISQHINKIWSLMKKAVQPAGEVVLKADGIKTAHIKDLSFSVKRGEVVGIAGVSDNALKDLPYILCGDKNRSSGEYAVAGKSLPLKMTIPKAIEAGVVLVPSDRFTQGAVMSRTLRENLLLSNEKKYFLHKRLADEAVNISIEALDIRPPKTDMRFSKFSGGNQQKAIIAKWLLMCPNVLILDDPTYGVDPAARIRIFSAVEASAKNGIGIIIFSTEPEQLASVCDRVLVMRGGEIVKELSKAENSLARESIARWCYA